MEILKNFCRSGAAATDLCILTAEESHCQNTQAQGGEFLYPPCACWLNEKTKQKNPTSNLYVALVSPKSLTTKMDWNPIYQTLYHYSLSQVSYHTKNNEFN